MFEYYPQNYTWSTLVLIALGMGGQISEIDQVLRDLPPPKNNADKESQEKAFKAWLSLAQRLERLGDEDIANDRQLSASRKYMRSCAYYILAESFVNYPDPRKADVYNTILRVFRTGISASGRPMEFVEIPYKGGALPALFVPAEGDDPNPPCVVHMDGADWSKEMFYLVSGNDLADRGMATLFVDTPGVGGALRLHGLTLEPETEKPCGACVDYLVARGDVDADRIAVLGVSLGGFYAPRAAAFEPRFAACAAWGALWDALSVVEHERRLSTESMPDQERHIYWMMGVENERELMDMLARVTLDGVMDKIRCPVLIAHTITDKQIPEDHAQKMYDGAINSSRRELKLFTAEDHAAHEHVFVDNYKIATDYIFDWLSEVLQHKQ